MGQAVESRNQSYTINKVCTGKPPLRKGKAATTNIFEQCIATSRDVFECIYYTQAGLS